MYELYAARRKAENDFLGHVQRVSEGDPPTRALTGLGFSTEQGRRPTNEDAETAMASIDPELPNHALLAVYDGHGGSQAATIAEQSMLQALRLQPDYQRYVEMQKKQQQAHRQCSNPESETSAEQATQESGHASAALLGSALCAAFQALDSDVLLPQLRKDGDTSGCTAIVLVITPTHFVCANCGDSRAVLFGSEAGVVPLSKDHKPTDPTERARIEAAGGSVIANRVNGGLAVARALGDSGYKSDSTSARKSDGAGASDIVTATPEVQIVQRRASDLLVIVACDGVWDVVSNELCCGLLLNRLALALADNTTSTSTTATAGSSIFDSVAHVLCSDLTEVCYGRGSRDNMSAVIGLLPTAKVAQQVLKETGADQHLFPSEVGVCDDQDLAFAVQVWRAKAMMKLPPDLLRAPWQPLPVGVDWSTFSAESLRSDEATEGEMVDCLGKILTMESSRARFEAQIEAVRRVDACSNARSCPWGWREDGYLPAAAFAEVLLQEWSGERSTLLSGNQSAGQPEPEPEPEPEVEIVALTLEDAEAMSIVELIAALEARELDATGCKETLLERIREAISKEELEQTARSACPHGAETASCSECRKPRRELFERLLLAMRDAPSVGASALPEMTRQFKAMSSKRIVAGHEKGHTGSHQLRCPRCCGSRPID